MKKLLALLLIFPLCFAPIAAARENRTFTKIGDWGQAIIPLSALAIAYTKESDYEGVKQLAKTYGSTMLITWAIKYSLNLERPNGGRHSFPSGHASSAFGGASFLAFRYGYKYGIPAYLAATAVAISRTEKRAHSVADVVASATISVICSHFFTTRYKEVVKLSTSPVKGGGQALSLEVAL
jgi:membrane-associated phospholipid phosphatase